MLDGLKVNGAGSGYFEYRVKWPTDLKISDLSKATFMMEASAKQLFGKDKKEGVKITDNYMLGGGTFDNSLNPNAYPQTDETKFVSEVAISFNGVACRQTQPPRRPRRPPWRIVVALSAPRSKTPRGGSYGYKLVVNVPNEALQKAAQTGELVLRLAVEGAGSLAIYGEKFGMYPFDPMVILNMK
ncbi:MAG: hypothetical protein R2822_20055 [Spirosomataceae bacterium]